MYAMSRKSNLLSLKHNCIPTTCCCDDALREESTGRDGERQVSELQQDWNSHLTCFAFSLHAWQWAHTSGQTQEDAGMQWAPALSTHTAHTFICTRKARWGEQGTTSRRVHTTLFGQNCQAVGTGIGDNAIWDVLNSKKALAHHRALAVTTNYGTSLSMICKYGPCSRSLTSS
jgi:hypothetical protein